jgi:GTP pyrophosphokinase
MNVSIEDSLSKYESLFQTTLSSSLREYIKELDKQFIEKNLPLEIHPIQISLSLMTALHPHHSDHSLALAAFCLPFAPHDQRKRFQSLLDLATFSLMKQCLHLQSLEKLLSKKCSLSDKQQDQLRKMLLAMAGDTRVIVLILQYQLVMLEHSKDRPAAVKQNLAQTVQSIYAPLANRLGMGHIKWQLEDWAFRYLNPDAYQKIKIALNMRRADRENYVVDMKTKIQALVSNLPITFYECDGRAKHIYSIYKKCSQKNVAYDALYDTIALRILTNTVDECYLLLSALHDTFTPITSEFDDYIANPKPNGYQSIHTVILGPHDHRIEIQIRTNEMHQLAEHGTYAHWIYKEGKQNETEQYEKKIASLRQLLEWQKTITQNETQNHTEISDLFADRIYVLSPEGRIIDLPQGATALDYAYHIHTDLGHKTKGAHINGQLHPLNHPLKNGDEIFIQTKAECAPSRDWLNPTLHFLHTKHAKQKILHWFRLQNQNENLLKGQQIWEKAWRSKKIDRHSIDELYQDFHFKDTDGLLIALGSHHVSIPTLCGHLKAKDGDNQKSNDFKFIPSPSPAGMLHNQKTHQRAPVIIDGNTGLLSQMAKCCRPIPGDSIIAYTSSSRGVIIHLTHCANVRKVSLVHPDKLLKASWKNSQNQAFEASLQISFQDSDEFLHELTSFCAQHKLPIAHLSTTTKKSGTGLIELTLRIKVQGNESLDKIIHELKNIKNVLMVSRFGS